MKIDANGGFCSHTLTLSKLLDREFAGRGYWAKVEKKSLILLSGEMAELVGGEMALLEGDDEMAGLFREAKRLSFESVKPRSDREELKELLRLVFGNLGPSSRDWVARAEAKAESIVGDNWKRVCALGDALIAKRTLSGNEATQIIQAA